MNESKNLNIYVGKSNIELILSKIKIKLLYTELYENIF